MQPQRKNSRVIQIALLGLALCVAYVIATPPQSSGSSGKRPSAKATLPVATNGDQYTADDIKAHFVKLDTAPPDVFKPLIYHATSGAGASSEPNAIPPDYANGEAGWTFTGIVAINNASQASFENDKTGEFVQVGVGQHWKGCSVSAIGADTVTLVGADGAKTLPLPVEAPKPQAPVAANTTQDQSAPLNPLTGPIGAQNQDATAVGQDNAQIQVGGGFGGGGGGRRGRRGRGRGGGGGGGGGGFGGGGPGGGG